MADYKLQNALPFSQVGCKETHFGRLCEIRADGIWVELDAIDAKNWIAANRVHGPLREDEPKKVEKVVEAPKELEVVEVVQEPVAEEKPTMTDVIENGSGKRKAGRPAKE